MQITKLLQEPSLCGVAVVAVTRPASDFAAEFAEKTVALIGLLEDRGIKVITKEKIHQKFALMDEKIVWYGSVNLLSFGRSAESMMRFQNAEIAAELLETLQKQKG